MSSLGMSLMHQQSGKNRLTTKMDLLAEDVDKESLDEEALSSTNKKLFNNFDLSDAMEYALFHHRSFIFRMR
jgi:hypothetical protein